MMAVEVAANHAAGAKTNKPVFLGLLAEGEVRRGEPERALALIEQAFADMAETRMWESDLHRRRGELLAARGPQYRAQALDDLHKAVAIAVDQGAVALERLATAALARVDGSGPAAARAPDVCTDDPGLSPRERELLGLVGRGLTDKEIAAQLFISLATVRSHLDRIRDKTARRRRPELTRLAVELGLTRD
jgi:DNA-binding CsgD family transcriptional regulator